MKRSQKIELSVSIEELKKLGMRIASNKKQRDGKFGKPIDLKSSDQWKHFEEWELSLFFESKDMDIFARHYFLVLEMYRNESQGDTSLRPITEVEYAEAAFNFIILEKISSFDFAVPSVTELGLDQTNLSKPPSLERSEFIFKGGNISLECTEAGLGTNNYLSCFGIVEATRKLGLQLPIRIVVKSQGELTDFGRTIGFAEDKETLVHGETGTEEHGVHVVELFDRLHLLESMDLSGHLDAHDRFVLTNPGAYVNCLEAAFYSQLAFVFSNEKHGRQTKSTVWKQLHNYFSNDRFSNPNFPVESVEKRMSHLFMSAMIAAKSGLPVAPSVSEYWEVAVLPYIESEASFWSLNSGMVNQMSVDLSLLSSITSLRGSKDQQEYKQIRFL